MCCEVGVYVEYFGVVVWMFEYDGVYDVLFCCFCVVDVVVGDGFGVVWVVFVEDVMVWVYGVYLWECFFEIVWECFVGGGYVGEECVVFGCWDFVGVEDWVYCGCGVVGVVGVLVVVDVWFLFGFFVYFGDLGMVFDCFEEVVYVDCFLVFGEVYVIVFVELLIVEEDDFVFGECVV